MTNTSGEDSLASQYSQSAEWYDRMYAAIGKDYRAEAERVDGIVRARAASATSLLDVGCGTGLHLEQFAAMYDDVAGIDLQPAFVARARSRCPQARTVVGDMRDFDLGRTFDVVTCLFSAIGHVGTTDDLQQAIRMMAQHLSPGGVLVIEPWLSPADWRDGSFGVEVAEGKSSTLVRAGHSGSDGDVSVLSFAWTEVGPAGIIRLDEELRLTRFAAEDFQAAFEAAELDATFDEHGCNDGGRGMWIATPRS